MKFTSSDKSFYHYNFLLINKFNYFENQKNYLNTFFSHTHHILLFSDTIDIQQTYKRQFKTA